MPLDPVDRRAQMPGFAAVAISGASRGLGAALALRFAAPGTRLFLTARDGAALGAVAAACAARGAAPRIAALDIRDGAALAAALGDFAAGGPVDLVIANAGMSAGRQPDGTPEDRHAATAQIAVNLIGAINLVEPLLPGMRARGAGAVALIASLAGLRGLPDCPGYSASKAGLIAWGEALRAAQAPRGIAVSVVAPGFFASAMGDRFVGRRPFLMPLDRAADRIARGIAAGAPRIVFPAPLAWGLRLGALLPARLSDRAIRLLRFRVAPDPRANDDAPR
jgi:short-subunit dehydrogenase